MRNYIFITLTALILFKSDCVFAQSKFPAIEECENKTNKEGKRTGKWLIPYKEYNWENSKLKVAFDVNNLDEIKLNPTSNNYDPNQLDPNQICFLENASYKNGLKHGKAYFYIYEKENKKTTPLASAKYDAGKLEGEVLFFNNARNAANPITKVLYKDGNLIDQKISGSLIKVAINGYQQETKALVPRFIQEYEIVAGGKSIESFNWNGNPSFSSSKLQCLRLALKICKTPRFNSYELSLCEFPSVIVWEKTLADNTKKIICMPISRQEKRYQQEDGNWTIGISPIESVTQLEQVVSFDEIGNITSYGELLIKRSSYRNDQLIDQNGGFFGLKPDKGCLIFKVGLNEFNGIFDGTYTEYFFNEWLGGNTVKDVSVVKAQGRYLNGMLDGPFYVYYPDNTAAAQMNFTNGKLDGRFTSYWSPLYDILYVPNFPESQEKIYNLDSEIGAPAAKKNSTSVYNVEIAAINLTDSKELFSELGKISLCNHKSPSKYKEISYACDFSKNKINSDIVYFYNEKNIIFRQGIDLNSFTDKDWKYYNTDGSVCLTQAEAVAMYKAQKENKQVAEEKATEELLNSLVTCNGCKKTVLYKNAFITSFGQQCSCYQNDGSSMGISAGMSSKSFCSLQCKKLFEEDCCRRNGYLYQID
jgi:antitoxin component YwqK of YwqJK toxin-antitoxin module